MALMGLFGVPICGGRWARPPPQAGTKTLDVARVSHVHVQKIANVGALALADNVISMAFGSQCMNPIFCFVILGRSVQGWYRSLSGQLVKYETIPSIIAAAEVRIAN
ncbi:hypothetical protein K449DRAFT_467730 [Hypoxylon sp. EC38]|nr:hypothetical protein K449DRAFT_467730 [Hypoxylon sp. EC38]